MQHQLSPAPPQLAAYTHQLMQHLGADVLGIDFLETADGQIWTLESNDIPGIRGFPAAVRHAIAQRLLAKLRT